MRHVTIERIKFDQTTNKLFCHKKEAPEGASFLCLTLFLGDVVTHAGEDHVVGALGGAANTFPRVT